MAVSDPRNDIRQFVTHKRGPGEFDGIVHDFTTHSARKVGVRRVLRKRIVALIPIREELLGGDLPRFPVRTIRELTGLGTDPRQRQRVLGERTARAVLHEQNRRHRETVGFRSSLAGVGLGAVRDRAHVRGTLPHTDPEPDSPAC